MIDDGCAASPVTIMSKDTRIRVIKLAERKRRAKARVKQARDSARRPEQDTARGDAATVSGWVDELRQQKRQGTDALGDFNRLFDGQPQKGRPPARRRPLKEQGD